MPIPNIIYYNIYTFIESTTVSAQLWTSSMNTRGPFEG